MSAWGEPRTPVQILQDALDYEVSQDNNRGEQIAKLRLEVERQLEEGVAAYRRITALQEAIKSLK